jgi:hypothetical protein
MPVLRRFSEARLRQLGLLYVRVIPVLVGGADMPKVSDLPDLLKDLVYRNAAVIEDRRFASDVRALQNAP